MVLVVVTLEERWLLESLKNLCFLLRFSASFLLLLRINVNTVPRGWFLYTMIVPRGGFLLPSSRVLGVCPGGDGFG